MDNNILDSTAQPDTGVLASGIHTLAEGTNAIWLEPQPLAAGTDSFKLDQFLVNRCRNDGATTVPKSIALQFGPIRKKDRLDTAIDELLELDRVRIQKEGKRTMLVLNPALLTSSATLATTTQPTLANEKPATLANDNPSTVTDSATLANEEKTTLAVKEPATIETQEPAFVAVEEPAIPPIRKVETIELKEGLNESFKRMERQQRALAILEENPSQKLAFVVDPDIDPNHVIVTLARRGQEVFDMAIPKEKYDEAKFLEVMNKAN